MTVRSLVIELRGADSVRRGREAVKLPKPHLVILNFCAARNNPKSTV